MLHQKVEEGLEEQWKWRLIMESDPIFVRTDKRRQTAYRALFRAPLNGAAIDDIRLTLNQNQPLGNSRFYARIKKATGVRRQARPRGRPHLEADAEQVVVAGQAVLKL